MFPTIIRSEFCTSMLTMIKLTEHMHVTLCTRTEEKPDVLPNVNELTAHLVEHRGHPPESVVKLDATGSTLNSTI